MFLMKANDWEYSIKADNRNQNNFYGAVSVFRGLYFKLLC